MFDVTAAGGEIAFNQHDASEVSILFSAFACMVLVAQSAAPQRISDLDADIAERDRAIHEEAVRFIGEFNSELPVSEQFKDGCGS